MNQYKSSAELKSYALEALRGNYGSAVFTIFLQILFVGAVSLVLGMFFSLTLSIATLLGSATASVPLFLFEQISALIISIITGMFRPGITLFFLNLISRRTASSSDLFYGFQWEFKKSLKLSVLFAVLYRICMLPLGFLASPILSMVPIQRFLYEQPVYVICLFLWILVSLPLSQVYYLMLDFPALSAGELIKRSSQLMKGNNKRMLYLRLSFLPVEFLGVLSWGIGLLWVLPYIRATEVFFFMELMQQRTDMQ